MKTGVEILGKKEEKKNLNAKKLYYSILLVYVFLYL